MRGGLRLLWSSGGVSQLPAAALRDFCPCPACRHPTTGQRTLSAEALQEMPFASVGAFSASPSSLSVRFNFRSAQPHLSTFSAEWLYRNAPGSRLALLSPSDLLHHSLREPWLASRFQGADGSVDASALSTFAFHSLADPSALAECFAALHRNGFVLVGGLEPTMAATEACVCAFGPPINTLYAPVTGMWRTEVLPSAASANIDTAFSSGALAAHTDGCYMASQPSLQVFHALQAASHGGDTLLVDGLGVAQRLRAASPSAWRFFTSEAIAYHHTSSTHHLLHARPVFTLGADGRVSSVSWNQDDRVPLPGTPARVRAFYRHLPALLAALHHPPAQLWLTLQPGTAIVFVNDRLLHGRSAFASDAGRVLGGAYVGADWEGAYRALTSRSPLA